MRTKNPWMKQPDEKEREANEKIKTLMAKLKARSKQKQS